MKSSHILFRSSVSIVTNICRAGLNFITTIMLAKYFSPEIFGKYGYLLATVVAIFDFISMGSSNAFYTFICKEGISKKHLSIYIFWSIVQVLIFIIPIIYIIPDSLYHDLFKGISKETVCISIFAIFIQQRFILTLTQLAESQYKTIAFQYIFTLLSFLYFITVFFTIEENYLTLIRLYYIMIIQCIIITVLFVFFIKINFTQTDSVDFNKYLKYCTPLILGIVLGSISNFLDPWLISTFSNKEQQAFLSISIQFSLISLIVIRSVLNIIWKEFSFYFSKSDFKKSVDIYNFSIEKLFLMSAFFSSILIFQTDLLVSVFLNEKYYAATIVMSLTLFYSIDQTRGQILGMIFLAMEKTKIVLMFSIMNFIIGSMLAFILLNDNIIFFGFNLGAIGIVFKMIIMQFITVNLSIYMLSRIFNIKHDYMFQIKVLSVFLSISFLVHFFLLYLKPYIHSDLFFLIVNIMVNSLFLFYIVFRIPAFFNISKNELKYIFAFVSKFKLRVIK